MQVRIGTETSSGPAVEAAPVDTTCFDSSWDLRQGLEVAELEALPEDLLPPALALRNPPEQA